MSFHTPFVKQPALLVMFRQWLQKSYLISTLFFAKTICWNLIYFQSYIPQFLVQPSYFQTNAFDFVFISFVYYHIYVSYSLRTSCSCCMGGKYYSCLFSCSIQYICCSWATLGPPSLYVISAVLVLLVFVDGTI